MRTLASTIVALAATTYVCTPARAASLPDHEPIALLIVSDGVNPHGLASHQLTEPGDLSTAIASRDSGISIAAIREVDSTCVDEALDLIDEGNVDVMVYFAHRSARACDGTDRQAALTAATEALLVEGGGVVVFHHGIYGDEGKHDMLELLGARADEIAWDTASGQRVIATARDHFITTHNVTYTGEVELSATQLGIGPGRYPHFDNLPDERYPGLQIRDVPGESRTILFVSDYAGPQILGYDLHRSEWTGHVVLYQPGEYKPHALDDTSGSNFQILANAIYYVATIREPEGDESESAGTPQDTGNSDDPGGPDDDTDSQGTGGNTLETEHPESATRCNVAADRRGAGLVPLLAALIATGRCRRRPRATTRGSVS